MEKDQRNGQEREPDVGAEPALHIADAQRPGNLFRTPSSAAKMKDAERDRAEHQAERSAADGGVLRRLSRRKNGIRRHALRMKLRDVEKRRRSACARGRTSPTGYVQPY